MNTKQKIEVMQAYLDGEVVQIRYGHGWVDWESEELGEPAWCWDSDEWRIKPKEVKKPSINWDHVSEEYNYLAVDEDGRAWFYTNKPKWHEGSQGWDDYEGDGHPIEVKGFASYTPPENCPPEDTLIKRPSKGE